MKVIDIFRKFPFESLRDAKRWLEEVRAQIASQEDLRRLVEVSSFYEDRFGAFGILKKAYLASNPQLCCGGGGVKPCFVRSERTFYERRLAARARRLGPLENALDGHTPADYSSITGRPDVVALQEASYQGCWV